MALIPQMTEQRQELLLKLLRREMKTGGARTRKKKPSTRVKKQDSTFFVLSLDGEDV